MAQVYNNGDVYIVHLVHEITKPMYAYTTLPLALAGSDYIASTATLSLGGLTPQCIHVSTIEDSDALEGNQTFTVVLTTSHPTAMLGNSVTTITLIDNDGKTFGYRRLVTAEAKTTIKVAHLL